jgi:hypothetical protein
MALAAADVRIKAFPVCLQAQGFDAHILLNKWKSAPQGRLQYQVLAGIVQ